MYVQFTSCVQGVTGVFRIERSQKSKVKPPAKNSILDVWQDSENTSANDLKDYYFPKVDGLISN